ncbi:hypothetical protein PMAYCL1PPCAC_31383, partial [Pristionchus mayeri]
ASISRCLGFDDESSQAYVNDFFTSTGSVSAYLNHDIADINDYILFVFCDHGFLNGVRWVNVLGSFMLFLPGDLAYKFMGYASYNIVQCLNKSRNMSERFHHQHVQLFRALVLQAITPFFTSYIPNILCGMMPFFGVDFPLFSVLIPVLCAFHPVLDALIMLATVSQFRNTMMEWIRCHYQRRNSRVIVVEEERAVDERGRR